MDHELGPFVNNVLELQKLIEALYGREQHFSRNNVQVAHRQYSPRSSGTARRQNLDPSSSSRKNRRSKRQRKSLPINDKVDTKQKTDHENSKFTFASTSKQKQPLKHITSSFGGINESMPKLEYSFVQDSIEYSTGRYVKSRNTKAKYISLRTFLKTNTKKTCIFNTEYSLVNLVDDLKKLDVGSEQVLKNVSKKYPRTEEAKKRENERSASKENGKTPFPDYITEADAKQGLENGSLIKGFVRINSKNFKDAYVSNEDTRAADYYLTSVRDRNRALEGDEVVLKLKPEKEWINGYKTASVVYLMTKVHPRIVVGSLKLSGKNKSAYAFLTPRDKRCPVLRIPEIYWPNGFKNHPKNFEKRLFVAKIASWDFPSHANGILTENLGIAGDLKVETLSILREFCLDTTPFPENVKKEHLSLPKEIPVKEFDYRADLRSECIFTIDPETARDLDDAVSVKKLKNDIYEIGVHISDASFYLNEGTELDQIVSTKATTIYMVDHVYHMLPEELCLYCSLLPGEDKLAFSVFWEMTTDGEILNKHVCRSIINSCAKLSYEHAQKIIENTTGKFVPDEFPQIRNNFSIHDIAKTVNILHKISVNLRQKRTDNGALTINQTKILFTLEPATGEPVDFREYKNVSAHRLIEEFMLLANITVAEKIRDDFPETAFLRCHEPPKQAMLVDLRNCLSSYGIHLDTSSSGAIRSSLAKYETNDYGGKCRNAVLNHLVAKAMTRARYFCSSKESENDYKHYALSVPIYTHFTSPIRRYADIMVHRLLSASLGYRNRPEWDVDYVATIAANCNGQKLNAKRAGEASCELYLAHLVESRKPFIQDCAVIEVKERSFDAIVLNTGSIVRIHQNNCEEGTTFKSEVISVSKAEPSASEKNSKTRNEKRQLKLKITFPKTFYYPSTTIDVEVFTVVKILLEKKNNSYKLDGTLLRPVPELKLTNQQ